MGPSPDLPLRPGGRCGEGRDPAPDGQEVDAIHPNDNTEYLNLGMEYAWNEILFLRGGWKSLFERDTEQGFTVGGGIHYRVAGSIGVMFDYAYQDWGILTSVHYLTFGVQF